MLSTTYSAKSGSTDTDNWMVGYNPDIVVAVWSGYDDARNVELSEDTKFGKFIWADSVEAYYRVTGTNPTWYKTPDDVIEIELSPFSGFYAGFGEYTKKLYFRKKNLPWYISLLKEENSNT